MTPKQARFVAEYRKDLNATQAAIRAGYSPKTARNQASELLAKPDIAAAVAKKTQGDLDKAGLTAQKVLEAIRRRLDADPRKMFDADGNHRPVHELGDEEASLIAGYEYVTKNAEAGDGHTDRVLRVKMADPSRYVEMAAKHFALLTEKVEHSLSGDFVEVLKAARARVANGKRSA